VSKGTVFIWNNAHGLFTIALALECSSDCEEEVYEAGKFLESLGSGVILTWSESLKRIVLITRTPLKLTPEKLREIGARLEGEGWEVRVAKEVDVDSVSSDVANGTDA